MKLCKDSQCKRSGQRLGLSKFPRCSRNKDGRYIYCSDCCRRRTKELRAAKSAREARRRELGIERKPMVLSPSFIAFSLVYDAINKGCDTREKIRRKTKLDWDSIGDVLVELVWECKAIRIEDRKFHLAA